MLNDEDYRNIQARLHPKQFMEDFWKRVEDRKDSNMKSHYPSDFIMPYGFLETVVESLQGLHQSSMEVRFVKPANLNQWEWTIRNCTHMCKVLKTIYHNIPTRCTEFNFVYKPRAFWNETTFGVEYDFSNYCFYIKTGLPYKGRSGEIRNRQVDLHEQAESLLRDLVSTMKNSMPSARANSILDIYNTLRLSSCP